MRSRPTPSQAARLRRDTLHADLRAIERTARAALKQYGEAADDDPSDDDALNDDPWEDEEEEALKLANVNRTRP